MATEIPITLVGNIVTEPELRFSQQGKPACSFRWVQADRVRNKQTDTFEDRKPELFLRVTVFGSVAENVVASNYKPGTRVIMTGELRQEPEWTTKEGEVRPGNIEFIASQVAASNQFATATVERAGSRKGAAQPQQQTNTPPQAAQQSASDPWAAQSTPQTASDPWANAGAAASDPWAAK